MEEYTEMHLEGSGAALGGQAQEWGGEEEAKRC